MTYTTEIAIAVFLLSGPIVAAMTVVADPHRDYPWPRETTGPVDSIQTRFAPPPGAVREPAPAGSFAAWLRSLPLLPADAPVRLYTGAPKARQDVHAAVVDIDIGNRNLQQCADAVMRLRAEYLRTVGRHADICFRFTDGSAASWQQWSRGFRPDTTTRPATWKKSARPASGDSSFRSYLTRVFQFAGTASLQRELQPVGADERISAGDIFIQGGFPGHAVIVVDKAVDPAGAQFFLLAQSYMPAQSIHVLKNPAPGTSPWYTWRPGTPLETPEWNFAADALRRFSESGCP